MNGHAGSGCRPLAREGDILQKYGYHVQARGGSIADARENGFIILKNA
jgi:hypothetical protein